MKEANIADLKNNLSHYIALVESGEEIAVCRRNKPVARILPLIQRPANSTKLGCGKGSVTVLDADLTEPFIPESDWEMHR